MTNLQQAHQPSIGWSVSRLQTEANVSQPDPRKTKNRVFNLGQPTDATR
jgi:hypothetical protein